MRSVVVVASLMVLCCSCDPSMVEGAVVPNTENPEQVAVLSRGLGQRAFINEVMANEPGSDIGLEYVELVNGATSPIDISGWTLSDAVEVRHTFSTGTVILGGRALVVYGAPGFTLENAVAASNGQLGLTNGKESVFLRDATTLVDSVDLTPGLTGTDGVSANRSPDATDGAAFVLHTRLLGGAARSSPGTHADGRSFGTHLPPPVEPPAPPVNPPTPQPPFIPSGSSFRVVTANLTSGNQQSYDTGEGQRILRGLKPDVVMIQEFNVGTNSPQEIRKFVDDTFGPEYSFFREEDAAIPNGVISRFPILTAGEWKDSYISNRDYAWARLDIPGNRELFAVSVHLSASNGTARVSEANQVAGYVKSQVSPSDYLVIGGDLNTGGGAAISELGGVVKVDLPAPVDQNGKVGTNRSRASRLDWVMPNAALSALQVPTVLANTRSFNSGLVVDTRVYNPLNDIAPAQSGDSGSPNMQHMAVALDFQYPN
ncbi:MAG: lamin tail domain-containing protein [Myxococcaceae bacterium]